MFQWAWVLRRMWSRRRRPRTRCSGPKTQRDAIRRNRAYWLCISIILRRRDFEGKVLRLDSFPRVSSKTRCVSEVGRYRTDAGFKRNRFFVLKCISVILGTETASKIKGSCWSGAEATDIVIIGIQKGWGCSSVGRAWDRHIAGSIPRCEKGFFSPSQLSVQTLLRCPYIPVCNCMH